MNNSKSKPIPAMMFKMGKRQLSIAHLVIICLLSIIIAIAAIPGYIIGKWTWQDVAPAPITQQLKAIRQTGLAIPGWKIIEHQEIPLGNIGNNQWLAQVMEQPGSPAVTLFLMPQDYYRNHPQVEWVDLDGWEKWKTDSHRTLNFSPEKDSNSIIEANFFLARKTTINPYQFNASQDYRKYYLTAWKDKKMSPQESQELEERIPWYSRPGTFALVQWYAWPGGGSFSPSRWFWADQWAQISKKRVPWIAVCLKIPIEPLSDIKEAESFAKNLAQSVQRAIEQELFQRHSSG